MYTSTTIADPSTRAQMLSQELAALVRERQAEDPTLGLPDILVATELLQASLLSESGVAAARSRVVAAVAAILIAGVAAALFLVNG